MEQRQLTFGEAVKLAITQNYCNFNGRSSRSEYWWYVLFTTILSAILSLIFGPDSIVITIVGLALFLPSLGLAVRRLHDVGRSGWWYLIALTGIGILLLIYWYVQPSQPTPNQYGPEPNIVA